MWTERGVGAVFRAAGQLTRMAEPFSVDVDVRFRDLDTMGHVNNAVIATYLEQARVAYYREILGTDLESVGTVIAHLEIDYRTPVDLADDVTVTVSVPELGESSLPMEYEVLAAGSVAATAETVQVAWDREAGESVPLPEEWRRAVESYEDR